MLKLIKISKPNMSPKAIVEIWSDTNEVLAKYNVAISEESLETLVETDILDSLLKDLNSVIGSSPTTCIEGG
jgi:hypothetical protein